MFYTDLDYRVGESKKVIQIGLSSENLGNFIAVIEDCEDAFTQFVLSLENGGDKFVFLTAKAAIADPKIDVQFTDICLKARDIKFIQRLKGADEQ